MNVDIQKVVENLVQKNAQLTYSNAVQEVAIADLQAKLAEYESEAKEDDESTVQANG